MVSAAERPTLPLLLNPRALGEVALERAIEPTSEQETVLKAIKDDISLPRSTEAPEYISPQAARAVCLVKSRQPQKLKESVCACFNYTLGVWDIGSMPPGTNEPFTVLPVPEAFSNNKTALHLVNWYHYTQRGFVRNRLDDICALEFRNKGDVDETPHDMLVMRAMVSAMADFDRSEPIDLRQSQALGSLMWQA